MPAHLEPDVPELRPMTMEELMKLHDLLSHYEVYLARQTFPPCWDSDEIDAIHFISECVEEDVEYLNRKNQGKILP